MPAAGTQTKKQKKVEKDTNSRKKLIYEKTTEELEEDTAQYIKEQLKPKVPPPREKVPLELGKKLLANLDNPPKPKSLPSDYDRTLTKAHKVRNQKKGGKTIPQLGKQQKELEPLRVPRLLVLHEADLQAALFLSEIGLTLDQATGQEEDIPVAPIVAPFEHRKYFVTEQQEMSLDTQMFNLHRWYLRMSNDETKMFLVKYRDHDFFPRGG